MFAFDAAAVSTFASIASFPPYRFDALRQGPQLPTQIPSSTSIPPECDGLAYGDTVTFTCNKVS